MWLVHLLSRVWSAIGWSITWQLVLLGLLAWLLQRLARVRQPHAVHALWWFVLLAPLVLTPLRVMLARHDAAVVLAVPRPAAEIVTDAQVARLIAPPMLTATPTMDVAGLPAVPNPKVPPDSPDIPAPAPSLWEQLGVPGLVAILWLTGCGAVMLRLLLGHRWVRMMLKSSAPVMNAELQAMLEDLCAASGVARRVELRSSELAGAPLLYGWRRPVIVLPEEWLESLSESDLHALLAHEMAHIVRHDFLVNVVQRMLAVPLFFHPVVWLAGRHISLAREQLCDAWVMERGAEPTSYARSLTAAARRAHARLALVSVGVAERKSTLLKRVEAITGADGARRLSRKLALGVAAVLLLSAAAFAAVQLSADGLTPDLEQALAELRSPDAFARFRASTVLQTSRDRVAPAVPALVGMLADDTELPGDPMYARLDPDPWWTSQSRDTTVGEQAVRVLAGLGEPALPGLSAALGDSNPGVRRGALLALAAMVEPARAEVSGDAVRRAAGEGIEESLGDDGPSVRQAAAYTLGMLRDSKAVAPLLEVGRDPDPEVRLLAVGGLGPLVDDSRARDALFAALADADDRVGRRAAFGLGYYGDEQVGGRLIDGFQSPDALVRARGAAAFCHTNDENVMRMAVAPLVALTQDPVPSVRAAALYGLRGPARVQQHADLDAILPLARDEDPAVRRQAMYLVAMRDEPEVWRARAAALRDPDPAVRYAALWGMWPRSEFAGTEAQRVLLDSLLEAARDADPVVRFGVAQQLGRVRGPGAVSALIHQLGDAEALVRRAAIRALGDSRDQRAQELLLGILREGDPALRAAAARALGALQSDKAVPDLLLALRDDDWQLREASARALGRIGEPERLDPLLRAADDRVWRVRLAAVRAIGELGRKETIAPLASILKHDPDYEVRAAAATALGSLGDPEGIEPLAAALKDQHPEVRWASSSALRVLDGTGTVGVLSGLLADEDPEVRSLAAGALGHPNAADAVECLLAALKDSNPSVRGAAAEALGLIGDPRAVTPLLGMIHDPDEYVRGRVSYALGDGLRQAQNKAVLEPLLAALSDPDPKVRLKALGPLLWIKDRRATEPVIDILLHDTDPQVRVSAISVLGEIVDPRAVEPLISTLERLEFDGAWYATWALGRIGGPRAEAFLLGLLHSSDMGLRRAAAKALGEIGSRAAVPDILPLTRDSDQRNRRAAARALAQIADPRATPVLVRLLKDDSVGVRLAAVTGLGEIGDPQNAEAIAPFLDDPDGQVRHAAAVALAKVGDRRTVKLLLTVLRDPDHCLAASRVGAAEAIGRLRDPAAVPALIEALRQDVAEADRYFGRGEPTPRSITAEVKALRAITGQDFGTDADKWQQWWDQSRAQEAR
jgi:HEAT repeat protein